MEKYTMLLENQARVTILIFHTRNLKSKLVISNKGQYILRNNPSKGHHSLNHICMEHGYTNKPNSKSIEGN